MHFERRGGRPVVDPSSRIAPNAVLCGDVTIGANCSVGFGAVIVAESGPVRIADNCVVMDTAVIRGVRGAPVTIGSNVLVGPRACLTGCTVEDEVFLATGATVFNGARIGARTVVRINGIVHLRTVLPAGSVVPMNWVAVGDPASILPPDRHDEISRLLKPLDFFGTVFGVERPPPGETVMPALTARYAAFLRSHGEDVPLAENDPSGTGRSP
ncbi:gamma carbonic anhydrase family protein [Arenibaculum sp.]|jgi:carbonic anhydrase/acetyltransferase-like protein (isoleucine patch superfamily)|uniref:gamma carbonic anhydrase family protein n=1 Tax=Arenibaculum sp. TaxID=2865862 RepID=UPI002E0EA4C7|nr:gamma carbonic anhydrase family protein [Arenibaculum sp.]